ncbi:hypothetical protein D3C80_1511130 [compost metagenome]
MDDAHERASIALGEDFLAGAEGADAEVTGSVLEVAGLQLVEQAAVHEHVADFIIQVGWFRHLQSFLVDLCCLFIAGQARSHRRWERACPAK